MSLNFHYAAHTYVDNWVVCDREARKVLGFGVEQRQLIKRRASNSRRLRIFIASPETSGKRKMGVQGSLLYGKHYWRFKNSQ